MTCWPRMPPTIAQIGLSSAPAVLAVSLRGKEREDRARRRLAQSLTARAHSNGHTRTRAENAQQEIVGEEVVSKVVLLEERVLLLHEPGLLIAVEAVRAPAVFPTPHVQHLTAHAPPHTHAHAPSL